MKIVVCVKQVPDTTEIKINPQTGTLIREGVPSILNPDDASALEAALEIRTEKKDAHITVVTMGPPQAKGYAGRMFSHRCRRGRPPFRQSTRRLRHGPRQTRHSGRNQEDRRL